MASVSAYQNAAVWKDFGNIIGIEVGMVETHCNASLQVYPNPTTGQLTIDNGELTIDNVVISDLMGRKHEGAKARRRERNSDGVVMNISDLPNGTYILRIITENGVVTKKVIKQ
jgi:hypothetical protein